MGGGWLPPQGAGGSDRPEATPVPAQTSPFNAPAEAGADAAETASGRVDRFMATMGPHVRARLEPTFDGAVGAAGGVLVGAGVLALAGGDGGGRGPVAAASIAIIVAGLVLCLALDRSWRSLRAAATAVGAIGIAGLATATPSPDGGSFLRILLLLATIGFIVAWVAPGYRGHPVMLGLALLSAAALLADLLGSDRSRFEEQSIFTFEIISVSAGRILLLAGLSYLAGVWVADRRGVAGVGTAFAVASLLATGTGAAVVAADLGDTGGSLLLLAVGTAVCAVGARSDRRATTWWGAALCALGAASLANTVVDAASQRMQGLTIAVAGAALVGAVTAAVRLRRAPPGPTVLPPPSPTGPPR